VRCPKCGTNNPPEEQLTYCRSCGTELRVVCPRCHADNPGYEEFCNECGLELHPNRGHERAAGIRRDETLTVSGEVVKKRASWTTMVAVGVGVLLLAWMPVFSVLRQRSQFNTCQSNLKHVALALQLYAKDNGEHLVYYDKWSQLLLPYLKDARYLACPARSDTHGYAYNFALTDRNWNTISAPGTTIAFFEASGENDMAGGAGNWLTPPAHSRGNNVVFLDGKVHVYRQTPPPELWTGRSGENAPETTPTPKTTKPDDKNATSDAPNTDATPSSTPKATANGTVSNNASGTQAPPQSLDGPDSAPTTPANGMPPVAPPPPPPTPGAP
jgi:ribosomal protein L40E/Tfp pilus assembly protein PilE